ncbi:hypothetical protein GCM10027258_78610 [Amycolatopsis stemonae]
MRVGAGGDRGAVGEPHVVARVQDQGDLLGERSRPPHGPGDGVARDRQVGPDATVQGVPDDDRGRTGHLAAAVPRAVADEELRVEEAAGVRAAAGQNAGPALGVVLLRVHDHARPGVPEQALRAPDVGRRPCAPEPGEVQLRAPDVAVGLVQLVVPALDGEVVRTQVRELPDRGLLLPVRRERLAVGDVREDAR